MEREAIFAVIILTLLPVLVVWHIWDCYRKDIQDFLKQKMGK